MIGLILRLYAGLLVVGLAAPLVASAAPPPPALGELKAQWWAEGSREDSGEPYRLSGSGLSRTLPNGEAASATSQAPEDVGDWSKLAFQSYRDGNWEIYLARGDGTQAVRLTDNGAADVRPRLNRGATQIVFTSQRTGNFDIYTMGANGDNMRQLTATGEDEAYPSWTFAGSQILFSRLVDERFGIWIMNADGSGARPLTAPTNADDVWPASSPDGRQVAWIKRLTDGARQIWLMNADGSNQHRISQNLIYLQNLTWSVDGLRLAFDCDYDRDYWNEIVAMKVSDGSLSLYYNPTGAGVDAWMGNWSPDDLSLVITLVAYGVEDGQLVIVGTGLAQIPPMYSHVATLLPDSGFDMFPNRQSFDLTPPHTTMQSLPAVSPAPVLVQWTGVDEGPAGVAGYDVQVRTTTGGIWDDWHMGAAATQASFPGRGGVDYYFRARARDEAGNVEPWPSSYQTMTTVEALAPISAMDPLPPFIHMGAPVRWSGSDPGNSGIAWYDVQYRRIPNGIWLDLWTHTTNTANSLWGEPGAQYAFRTRAQDRAQNLEAWPPDPGDVVATTYRWAVRGLAFDNRSGALDGTTASTTPAAFASQPTSGGDGYASYVTELANTFAASWNRSGYGSLPKTEFRDYLDQYLDVVIPPANDAISNGSFEESVLAPAWSPAGVVTPTLTTYDRHTGRASANVGMAAPGFTPPFNLAGDQPSAIAPTLLVASDDSIHATWSSYRGIYYRRRQVGQPWQPMQVVSSTGYLPQLVLDADTRPHVIWLDTNRMHYTCQDRNGSWSPPETLPVVQGIVRPGEDGRSWVVDGSGIVHAVWVGISAAYGFDTHLFYSWRDTTGKWSAPLQLTSTGRSLMPWLGLDARGNLHLAWWENLLGKESIRYRWRSPQGDWSATQIISGSGGVNDGPACVFDDEGNLHVLYPQELAAGGSEINYTWRSGDGGWSAPAPLAAGTDPYVAADSGGNLHAAWSNQNIYYAHKARGAPWSPPEQVSDTAHWASEPTIVVDGSGAVHSAWYAFNGDTRDTRDLWYAVRDPQQGWIRSQRIAQRLSEMNFADWGAPRLGVDSSSNAHLAWTVTVGFSNIYYAWGGTVPAAGDSRLWQHVEVPLSAASPTLSWMYDFNLLKAGGANRFDVSVDDGLQSTSVFSTTVPTPAWTHAWADMSPWAGRPVTVTFSLHHPANAPAAWALVDEVSLGSGAYPDLWAQFPTAVGQPGASVTTTLLYGNKGDSTASSTVLQLTLPDGLALVRAEPPPSAVDGQLVTWEMDSVAPGAQSALMLVLGLASQTPPATIMPMPFKLQSPVFEADQGNNEVTGLVFAGGQQGYLPLVTR